MSEEKTEEVKVMETPKAKPKKVTLTPDQLASRQNAHAIKVAKFLAGGK